MTMRDCGVDGNTPASHAGEGGSIPAQSLFFHLGEIDEARDLVLKHHYSGRWPPGAMTIGTLWTAGGLFGTKGECVAACVFGEPAARWSHPVGELTRLVRVPDKRVPLSMLVAMTCRKAKADLLVSFADVTQGHHGGVYQACGWNYHGQRERRMDGVIYGGSLVPGRAANSAWGTQSPSKLAAMGIDVEPHYDEGKHLYWKARTKAGIEQAASLQLASTPYPKPSHHTPGTAAPTDDAPCPR